MKIDQVQIKVIRYFVKSGVAKATQKPYAIPLVEVVDSEYNKFELAIPKTVEDEHGIIPEWLREAKDLDVEVDIEISPKPTDKGYGNFAVKLLDIRQ